MKKEKLKLESVKIKSFVTELDDSQEKTIQGGSMRACTWFSCPNEGGTTPPYRRKIPITQISIVICSLPTYCGGLTCPNNVSNPADA